MDYLPPMGLNGLYTSFGPTMDFCISSVPKMNDIQYLFFA